VVDGKLTRPKELAVNKIGHGESVLCSVLGAAYESAWF
jgi:hypothetical protein